MARPSSTLHKLSRRLRDLEAISSGIGPSAARTDSRSARFELEHGRLVQVELDALPPDELRALYENALAAVWDKSAYEDVCEREGAERTAL